MDASRADAAVQKKERMTNTRGWRGVEAFRHLPIVSMV